MSVNCNACNCGSDKSESVAILPKPKFKFRQKYVPRQEILHIIVPLNNYMHFARRYELFVQFYNRIKKLPGTTLTIVEVALADEPFAITDQIAEFEKDLPADKHTTVVQMRTCDIIWHKENMINLGISMLPWDWKYCAWIDADVQFNNPRVVEDTIHQLRIHAIVQMFESAVNLGPRGETIDMYKSFCYQYLANGCNPPPKPAQMSAYAFWHPGFAWACTREAFETMGGLIDFAILGAGDHHMAYAFIGLVDYSYPGNVSESYQRKLREFQHRCGPLIGNIGWTPGSIYHSWHGKFKDRRYRERWDILRECKFDPDRDIYRDYQGMIALRNHDARIQRMANLIILYFKQRNEDSMDKGEGL